MIGTEYATLTAAKDTPDDVSVDTDCAQRLLFIVVIVPRRYTGSLINGVGNGGLGVDAYGRVGETINQYVIPAPQVSVGNWKRQNIISSYEPRFTCLRCLHTAHSRPSQCPKPSPRLRVDLAHPLADYQWGRTSRLGAQRSPP